MICNSCGEKFNSEERELCPKCGAPASNNVQTDNTQDEQFNDQNPQTETIAWENKKLSFFERLFITFKESVFNPSEFFKKVPPKGEIFMPFLYAVVWVIISQLIGLLYLKLFGDSIFTTVREILESSGVPMQNAFDWDKIYMQSVAQTLMLPFLYMILIFVVSGVYHLLLMILGSGKQGYIATFRTLAYTQGAKVFNIIPIMGGIIAFVWETVLLIIGLKELHKTTYGKVVVAIIVIPFALCAFCCIAFIFMIIGAAGLNS